MFYQILDNLCKKNGTTVTAVLKELNISTSKGTAWKNGSTPNADILLKLAQYFQVSMEYLMGVADSNRAGESVLSPEVLSVILKLSELSDDQLHEVAKYIDYQRHK